LKWKNNSFIFLATLLLYLAAGFFVTVLNAVIARKGRIVFLLV